MVDRDQPCARQILEKASDECAEFALTVLS
jgi:hypothetical protein